MRTWKPVKILSISIFTVIALWLLYFFLCPISRVSNRPDVVRLRNTACVGYALFKYQADHTGHLPDRLSDLVPRYIAPTNIGCFFWPPKSGTTADSISENLSHEIDYEGAFVYLADKGFQENLILYERTNLWPQDQDAISVLTVTTNFTPTRLSAKDIETRLARLHPVGTTP